MARVQGEEDHTRAATGDTSRLNWPPGSLGIAMLRVLVLLAGVLVWYLAATFGWGRSLVVSSPQDVAEALKDLARDGDLFTNLVATLQATVIALVLAAAVGITIGLVLAMSPTAERVVDPYLSAVNSMPRIALAPVFIVYFGITTSAKVALAFSLVVFIIILNTRAGVHGADVDVVRMIRVMGATRRQRFTKVLLPAAAPAIFAGLRLGIIYSLLGVVGSELIASRDGMGQLIAKASGTFDLATVYAVLIVLAVAATLLNGLMRVAERLVLRWQPVEQ